MSWTLTLKESKMLTITKWLMSLVASIIQKITTGLGGGATSIARTVYGVMSQ